MEMEWRMEDGNGNTREGAALPVLHITRARACRRREYRHVREGSPRALLFHEGGKREDGVGVGVSVKGTWREGARFSPEKEREPAWAPLSSRLSFSLSLSPLDSGGRLGFIHARNAEGKREEKKKKTGWFHQARPRAWLGDLSFITTRTRRRPRPRPPRTGRRTGRRPCRRRRRRRPGPCPRPRPPSRRSRQSPAQRCRR